MRIATRPGTLIRWHALKRVLFSSVRDGMTVLDIGGYDGYIACQIQAARNIRKAIVMDMDMQGLITARERMTGAVCASALAIPLPDNAVDLVLCLDLLEHVVEDEMLIREVGRVLREGGRLILTTPAETGMLFPFLEKEAMAQVQMQWGHLRPGYRIEDIRRILRNNRIAIEQEGRYFNFSSRLAYRTLILPGPPSRIAWRLFRGIAALEYVTDWGAQEHIVVGRKCDS